MRFTSKQSGFTLIELLLSSAIIMIIAGLTLSVGREAFVRNDLASATDLAATSLRRAQALSQANYLDSDWGVAIQTGQVVLFRGNSFASRDASYDELSEIASTLQISGTQEYVFERVDGRPYTDGAFTMSSTLNDVTTMSISPEGVISY